MRAIWKGHISFGLVNVPVALYSAEQRADVSFHLIDSRDFSRVRYERVNAETGEEVPWDQVVKGYEFDDGSYVVMQKEELEQVAPEAAQTVEIEAFVDLDQIDPMYFDKPYYLEPGKKGAKGYALLREVLRASGRVGIARVVIRSRQYIAAMAPRDDALVLTLLRYPQEIASMDELDLPGDDLTKVGVTKSELNMARTLVDSMSADWNPDAYHDEYREALMARIEQKIEAGEINRVSEAKAAPSSLPPTINLMDALKQSVKQSGGSGGKKKSTTAKTKKKAKRRKKAG
ncbi:MAG TPA: Ku protein [Phycisphaerae bacterium]|nr:Ku protein [Phycisphaerae bacterium]